MSLEPPLHEPENKQDRKRDFGHTLVLVGYLLVAFDVILGCYFFIALRDTGGKFIIPLMGIDIVAAVILIAIGMKMKKAASRLGP
jgi:hypothetical protein